MVTFDQVKENAVRIGDVVTDFSRYDSLIADVMAFHKVRKIQGYTDIMRGHKDIGDRAEIYTEWLKGLRVEFLETIDALADKKECSHLIKMKLMPREIGWTRGEIISNMLSLGNESFTDGRCEIKDVARAMEYARTNYPGHEAEIDRYHALYSEFQEQQRKLVYPAEVIQQYTAQRMKHYDENNKNDLAQRAQAQKALDTRLKQRARSRTLPDAEQKIFQDEYNRFRKENRTMARLTRSIMSMERKKIAQQYKYENGMLSDRAAKRYEKNAAKLMDKSIDLRLYALRQIKETEAVLQFTSRDSDIAKIALAHVQHLRDCAETPDSLRIKKIQEQQRMRENFVVQKANSETRQKSKEFKEYMREQRKEKEAASKDTATAARLKSESVRTAEEKTIADSIDK